MQERDRQEGDDRVERLRVRAEIGGDFFEPIALLAE